MADPVPAGPPQPRGGPSGSRVRARWWAAADAFRAWRDEIPLWPTAGPSWRGAVALERDRVIPDLSWARLKSWGGQTVPQRSLFGQSNSYKKRYDLHAHGRCVGEGFVWLPAVRPANQMRGEDHQSRCKADRIRRGPPARGEVPKAIQPGAPLHDQGPVRHRSS